MMDGCEDTNPDFSLGFEVRTRTINVFEIDDKIKKARVLKEKLKEKQKLPRTKRENTP